MSQKFPEWSSKEKAKDREERLLQFWKKKRVFERGARQNASGPSFVFFEGPPTANGRPGIHHVLSRVYKDIYIRFHMQQGFHVPRRAGWDCHGLPVEREVEKELGIQAKSEIEEKYGISKFNDLCRQSVLRYVEAWDRFTERMAFWVDLKKPYFTMDNSFMESVWSLLKGIWERGLIYQSFRVTPIDPVMGATMSDAEVDLGYRETEDPSLTVRFALAGDEFGENVSLLVWTTTPWTLPSNVALAVAPDAVYLLAERDAGEGRRERLIFAEALQNSLFADQDLQTVKKMQGRELEGLRYRQLLPHIPADPAWNAFRVICADFVTLDTGTGIVHLAPAYGADDLAAGQAHGLPVVHGVGLDGKFLPGTPHAGLFFKDADPLIVRELKQAGLVFKSERYKHNYPFGYRTGAPLIYFAKNAWYIRTTEIREQMIANNQQIRWVPDHVQNGRFGNWLAANRDWALSRERYWGTPLPIWTDGEGEYRVIGSVKELEKLCGRKLGQLDLHRPHIDEITFVDPESGRTMRRVAEVIDCWFDSGAMPYAQWGWPARGKSDFARYFPADFICEAVDQTRGWFYTLLAISTMASDCASYRNVVCLGHVLDEKGEKMSKSRGNVVDPWKVFEIHGADAIRWYFLTQAPPGNARRVGQPGDKNDPVAVVHGLFNMLANSVSFFSLYANVDGVQLDSDWQHAPIAGALPAAQRPPADRWILSARSGLIEQVTSNLKDYDCLAAGKAIEEFADSLSNWYIRRNRRRFWKGALDADKLAAYDTLHLCLTAVAQLLAPFAPFFAEEMYQQLVCAPLKNRKGVEFADSVHLAGWPQGDAKSYYDAAALREGELVKLAAFLGRAARADSGVKVRQPLSRLLVHVERAEDRQALENNADTLLDELNVKSLEFLDGAAGILEYRIKPNLPRIGRSLGARVKEVQQFILAADARQLAARIKRGENISIGEAPPIVLAGEDFLLESISAEGVSGAESGGLLVALDTRLNEALIQEGMVRELVRNIQELRKGSGLEVTDRIRLQIEASERLQAAAAQHRSYIDSETLAEQGSGAGEALGQSTMKLEGEEARIRLWKL
ncbi:MAG: isoleucine--tRNA ligase [Leptospirales bacterium]|nr:isoleucine--tRNA ligase [Leptospirales bacterium]